MPSASTAGVPFGWLLRVFLLSVGLSICLVGLTRAVSLRLRFVDRPNPNTGNVGGAALGGGIAICAAITVLSLLFLQPGSIHGRVIITTGAVCGLGLLDDLISLNPLLKVIGQATCGAFYVSQTGVEPYWFVPITMFLILSSNAWNVVDVMDSLLAWIGWTCFAGMFLVSLIFGLDSRGFPAAALIAAGAVLGFLVWNRPPAKVLMGDAGSLSLGMLFGLLVVEAFLVHPSLGSTLVLTGLIPFLEVGFLMFQRLSHGTPFYRTTPDHFALRMIHNGFSIPQVIRPVVLASVVLSMFACLMAATSFHGLIVAIIIAILLPSVGWSCRYFSKLPVRNPVT